MGFYKFIAVVITLAMLLMPLAALDTAESPDKSEGGAQTDEENTQETAQSDAVKVFMMQEEVVLSITVNEYIVGVLAAEMLPTYHEQALRAQAVAAYTYLLYKKSEQQRSPDSSLKGAYISDDSSVLSLIHI